MTEGERVLDRGNGAAVVWRAMKTALLSCRSVDYVTVYRLTCEHTDPQTGKVIEPGWGFSFDCDAAGKVDETRLQPAALANLRAIRAGTLPTTPLTVESHEERQTVAAVMRCDCGAKFTLNDSWATGCDCGREYNGSGQLLAPRSQWGEETGEEGTF